MKNIKHIEFHRLGLIFLVVLLSLSSLWCHGQDVIIAKKSSWKYLDTGQNLGTSWNSLSYNDDFWLSGPGILGYGEGDEGTLVSFGSDSRNKYVTTYFRRSFTIANTETIEGLKVCLLRDDGAVVYLNGQELFSSNMSANPNYLSLATESVGGDDERTYFEFIISADLLIDGTNVIAVEVHQNDLSSSDLGFDLELLTSAVGRIRINEVLSNNVSCFPDPDYNQFVDLAELYNPTSQDLTLSGFYLTDDLNCKDKWSFPAGSFIPSEGYLVVYVDGLNNGLHTNFKLSGTGENLALFNAEFELVDSLSFPKLDPNISFGRSPSGDNLYFGEPSLGVENFSGVTKSIRAANPGFSQPAGFYNASVTLILSSEEPNSTIRYTLNGNDPDQTSEIYQSPLVISSNTVVKARTFSDGILPSTIESLSFFINTTSELPVISIGTSEKFLYDSDVGVYRSDRLTERKEWERPGTMEFFEPDGSLGFRINIDYRLFGRGAVHLPQKSLAIFPRGTDGSNGLDYELFPGTSVRHFQSFLLRSSSDDWRNTMFRDGMIHSLLKGQMDLEYQDYRPAVLYINGKYMGIHNLRDKLNESYISTHRGVDPKNIDLLYVDNDYTPPLIETKSGDNMAYWAMWNFIVDNDMSNPVNYQIASGLLDIDNYQNYCVVQIISGNRSWLHNRRVWRPRTPGGKFRYMLFDLDYGYIFLQQNILNSLNTKDMVFKNLMKNSGFKTELVQKLAVYSQTTFATERVLQFIDNLSTAIENEIPRHSAKWGSTYSNIFTNKSEWETKVEVMRDFARQRPERHESYIQSFLNQVGRSRISFEVDPPGSGEIWVNNKKLTDDTFSGDFYNNYQLKISGHPGDGYSMESWEGISSSDSLLIVRRSTWKYNDLGQDLGTSWRNPAYDDAAWSSAAGILGFGRSYVNSVIGYGNDEDHKHTTTYFRKTINVSDPSALKTLFIRLLYDDGVVVYINGNEKFRVNMPSGTINFSTFANGPMWGELEGKYYDFQLSTSDLVVGDNTIAVEVHQDTFVSSDLGFDIEMGGESASGNYIQTIYHSVSEDLQVKARFKRNHETDVIISEVFYRPNSEQGSDNAEYIEFYNKGNISFDLTGYVFSAGVDFEFPANTILDAGKFLLIASNAAKYSQTGGQVFEWDAGFLSNVGEALVIIDGQSESLDSIVFGISNPWPLSQSGYSIELCDINNDNSLGSSWALSHQLGGSPGIINGAGKFSKLRINEFVGVPGGAGYYGGEDWIEIKNLGNETIDFGGMYISDEELNPLKYQIPEDAPNLTSIPAGGYAILIADGSNVSSLNLPFKLSGIGGGIILSEAVGETFRIIDKVTYTYLVSGKSIGRSPDGTGRFVQQIALTPLVENLNFSKNIISPYEIKPGDRFPVVVRITDENGEINKLLNSTLTLTSSVGTINPDKIRIRNGTGTQSVSISSNKDFEIGVAGYNYSRKVIVNPDRPEITLKGPIKDSVFLLSGIDYILSDSLVINSGAVLSAGPDVRILAGDKINIWSKGLLNFNGSIAQPIIFMPIDRSKPWGGIKVQDTPEVNSFKWVFFTKGGADSTQIHGHSFTQPIIFSDKTFVEADNVFMIDNIGKGMHILYSEARINNSVFSRCDLGTEFSYSWGEVRNSWFIDLPDADHSERDDDNDGLYFSRQLSPDSPPCIVDNCVISGTEDDGIDTSWANLIISNCIFNRNYEKGISCGWRSNIEVHRSLFYQNYIGISSTFWTPTLVSHCTFDKNSFAFWSSYGGGGTVVNSILSNHHTYYAKDTSDAWNFQYCLSDKDEDLFGLNNYFGNPGFVNADQLNFNLAAGSEAIDAGYPEYPRDADGSPADIGAYPYYGAGIRGVAISEIYYNPPASQGPDSQYEFIEIVNTSTRPVNITGYRIAVGIDYSFPAETYIEANEIIVVASDAFAYDHLPGRVFQWKSGQLSNGGELISLVNSDGKVIDDVYYSDNDPWSSEADGKGYSLEVVDPKLGKMNPQNWRRSFQFGGTPGEIGLVPDYNKIFLNEIQTNFDLSSTWVEIYNSSTNPINCGGFRLIVDSENQWVIPINSPHETNIPPNGYLVIYLNSNESMGLLHSPLEVKLNSMNIQLQRLDNESWIDLDQLKIPGNSGGSSFGRYPDGSETVRFFNWPTPLDSNDISSHDIIALRTIQANGYIPFTLIKDNSDFEVISTANFDLDVQANGNLIITDLKMVNGVASLLSGTNATEDFILSVPYFGDSVTIKVENEKHREHLDRYIIFDKVWTSDHEYYIDSEMEIPFGKTLIIKEGTRVYVAPDVNITVYGTIIIQGTKRNPVLFGPQDISDPWGQIDVKGSSIGTSFSNVFFIGGGGRKSNPDGRGNSQAVLGIDGTSVSVDNCYFMYNQGMGIYAEDAILTVSESQFSFCDTGIECKDSYLAVDSSSFSFLPDYSPDDEDEEHDGIYTTGANSGALAGKVTNSYFGFISDDAVETLDRADISIVNCFFRNIANKAISGSETDISISMSFFVGCSEGIVAKEGSYLTADHVTMVLNEQSLRAYSNYPTKGYGDIQLSNSIIYKSTENDLSIVEPSSISINYTLSDQTDFPDEGNIIGDPLFVNYVLGDFNLMTGSIAINAGDPEFALDEDGSVTDLGAITGIRLITSPLIINEIMYAPKSGSSDVEFVELYNKGIESINLTGYTLSDGINFEFSSNTHLDSKNYLIVTLDKTRFDDQSFQVFQWNSGDLSNNGDIIQLINANEEIIDVVNYGVTGNWPEAANGAGPSLELKIPDFDNNSATNWQASYVLGGTPGLPNSSPSQEGVVINEFMARNYSTIENEFGEYTDWMELYNPTSNFIQLDGLYLSKDENDLKSYRISGNKSELLLSPGEFVLFWLDASEENGTFHTNFELAGSGGFLAISKSNGLLIEVLDSISYNSMTADVSYGRSTDGTEEWIPFDKPTPGTSNSVGNVQISGVYINEVMARNSQAYLNDIGEYDDWIEIYNSTNKSIDLGGLYFSDDAANPLKFKVPLGNSELTMEPKSFLMLYPTAKPEDGVRHLDFQLAGGGEHVSMSQIYMGETHIIDSVTYPSISTDMAYARMWDGGRVWDRTTSPTPNASNGTSSIRDNELSEKFVSVFPNPVNSRLNVSLTYPEMYNYHIELINILSQEILVLGHADNLPAYRAINLSWSIDELGIKHSSFWLMSLQINDKSYFKKLILIKE